jgi:hypothetical protein
MFIPKSMLTLIDTVSETVKQSLTTFVENGLENKPQVLSAELVGEVNRGLAQSLDEAGRAALKAFIEQFDTIESEITRDGRIYRFKETSGKKFVSPFGEMELERRCYRSRDRKAGIVPLDEGWEMQGRYAAPEVVENLLWASATLTPGQVAEFCTRMGRFGLSGSCIQDIIARDGAGMARMTETEEDRMACRKIEVPGETEVLAVSLDGANVLLREKGTRCGRPVERPVGSGGEGSRNREGKEYPSSYRNAMVGSFSFYTRVDGVVDIQSGVEGLLPERLGSVYCGRMPEERAVGFKQEFEAITADICAKIDDREVTRILLIDGARPLWNYVEGNPLFEGFRLLLDYFHATEHLSRAAEAIFGKQSTQARNWYDRWRYKLKYEQGAADGILRSMTHYRKVRRIPASRSKDLEREITFFKRNKERMNYHEHIANGWPIGSGPVEAACKTIVKARLCQSGMRWSRTGGRNILALRVLYKSRQWNQAWKHYRSHHWQTVA